MSLRKCILLKLTTVLVGYQWIIKNVFFSLALVQTINVVYFPDLKKDQIIFFTLRVIPLELLWNLAFFSRSNLLAPVTYIDVLRLVGRRRSGQFISTINSSFGVIWKLWIEKENISIQVPLITATRTTGKL